MAFHVWKNGLVRTSFQPHWKAFFNYKTLFLAQRNDPLGLVEVFLPVARAYGVGQALTADRPVVVRTLEEAERELTRRRSNRTSYQGRDRHTSAQQALDRIHDEQSPLGCVRRVCWPVRESDAEGSDVLTDWDPFR